VREAQSVRAVVEESGLAQADALVALGTDQSAER
jgi:diaminopimelate decarboxylase